MCDFICESRADLVPMTETWLCDDDSAVIHEITPEVTNLFINHDFIDVAVELASSINNQSMLVKL